MNAIICLDEKNGMMFNKRRQSRDSVLNQKVLEIATGKKLLMNGYSAKLFGENSSITVEENFLDIAQKGDFCFIEKGMETLQNVENLYVFLWNRHYPADVYFRLDIEKEGFVLQSTEEFPGTSHEKITLNIYKKEG